MSMELIDRKQLQIETQTLEDVGQSEMQFYSVEQVDNAPTVQAISLDKVEQIRAEIEKRMETITGRYDNSIPEHDRPLCICARNEARQECIEIIDKAIKEYMDGNK